MQAIAMVVSARRQGNGYDAAHYVLDRLRTGGVETELVNFCEYRIEACQGCEYECESRGLPERLTNVCPIDDDVPALWQKLWQADILLLCLPTYRGYPPALWIAFLQRGLGLKMPRAEWLALQERMQRATVSAMIFASPDGAAAGEWTPAIAAGHLRWLKHKVADFEVIDTYAFEKKRLIEETEVQRRLAYLAERTLAVAREMST